MLMEPTAAALPRSFSILSPAHLDGSQDDDNVLPFISRMLMEDDDDVVDEFLYQQQYLDHNPAFLHTQQLFSQALLPDTSSIAAALPAQQPCDSIVELHSTTIHSSTPAAYHHFSHVDDTPVAATAVQSEAQGNLDVQEGSGSSSCKDAVSMAFFRGMEEANKFLPGDGSTASDRSRRGRKKRLEDAGDAEGRSSKQMAAGDGEESEEYSATREMLDQLMLTGDDDDPTTSSSLAQDMQELRAAMDIAKNTPRQPLGRPAGSRAADPDHHHQKKQQNAVDLHSMLIRCADAVASNDRRSAADLLDRIRRHASPSGDATQRLAHCFAEGLEVRLNGSTGRTLLQHYCRPYSSSSSPSVVHQQLKARQLFMASCCFLPVNILFSNRTIYDACAGRRRLHVVHYGLSDHGLQWATLLRWLARRDGGPPAVRLTGIDAPRPGFRPAQLLEEAGRRLAALARRLGVPFTFRAIAARSEAVRAADLDIDPDEVLAVSSLFHFSTLTDESMGTVAGDRDGDGTDGDPIAVVLGAVREMRPAVFVHAVLNASYSTAFFATRFREALYNFTALFDMMDTVLPREHGGRMGFERDVLARWAVNAVACEGADRVQRPRSYKQWQARSERAGLRQLPLDRGVVQTVRDKVRKEYHRCFVISEDQRWLLQGWKGRVLYAVSTWTADG